VKKTTFYSSFPIFIFPCPSTRPTEALHPFLTWSRDPVSPRLLALARTGVWWLMTLSSLYVANPRPKALVNSDGWPAMHGSGSYGKRPTSSDTSYDRQPIDLASGGRARGLGRQEQGRAIGCSGSWVSRLEEGHPRVFLGKYLTV
jgi:hypothetical protein